jgi:pimeloyl-ACP methyl ester carboxylesterase
MTPGGVDALAEVRMLDVVGGRTLVRLHGEGGVPLVLLHGVLSDGGSWSAVAGPLSHGRSVIAPDQPLHGNTQTPNGFAPDRVGMVEWLEGTLDALAIECADVCGLSMGGAVGSHFARLRPERVRRLVLVDAANVTPMDEAYMSFISEVRNGLDPPKEADTGVDSGPWSPETGLEGAMATASDLRTDPIVLSVLAYLEARGIPLDQMVAGLDLLEPLTAGELGEIRAPTMAIWGSKDPFFSAQDAATALESGLPSCRIEVIDGSGHNPIIDNPVRFVELVEDFLR